jgi:hypothetical protein
MHRPHQPASRATRPPTGLTATAHCRSSRWARSGREGPGRTQNGVRPRRTSRHAAHTTRARERSRTHALVCRKHRTHAEYRKQCIEGIFESLQGMHTTMAQATSSPAPYKESPVSTTGHHKQTLVPSLSYTDTSEEPSGLRWAGYPSDSGDRGTTTQSGGRCPSRCGPERTSTLSGHRI